MIKFGTDGWRAILDDEFSEQNVKRVTLAIGKYVYETFGFNKLILIGYDPRNKASEYAEYCANILAGKGFQVKLSTRIIPTPILAYNAKLLNASAIMFTASHNPANYLGMKYIPDYAGPATNEITDKIISNIDKDFLSGESKIIQKVDFAEAYYEHLKTLINYDIIRNLKTNIIFDGLYSASIGYFDEILKDNGISFESLNMRHDINFGGGMPDPKPKYLKALIEKVIATPNSIGLANDGDADRFGIINEKGEYVSPNEIIAILLKYLKSKGLTGAVVKTVGSSMLIDKIAEHLGIEVIETAVGFKHVGEAMRLNKVIIGGEESGGLSIDGHIPEKDGLIANLLVLEAMASRNCSLVELQNEIKEITGAFYNDRIDLKKSNSDEIKFIIEKFKKIKNIGKFTVSNIDLKDGVKLMLGEKIKILVRPSGTEPLLRIYFETNSEQKLEEIKQEVEKIL
ncbi:phosphoglucomutase/phosphomannomutase family protein [bacterium]|nr:phosphoglucomutase/phosphomannomutase family protein [bacterium]